jgi:hypothetical protein
MSLSRRRFLGVLGVSALGSLSGCLSLAKPVPTREPPVPETEAEREIRLGDRAQEQFEKGMTVNRMADILGRPAWLKRERVVHYVVLGGYIPLNWGIGQTALQVALAGRPTTACMLAVPKPTATLIYVAVDGRITGDEFHALLTGTASKELVDSKGTLKVTDFTIVNVAWSQLGYGSGITTLSQADS